MTERQRHVCIIGFLFHIYQYTFEYLFKCILHSNFTQYEPQITRSQGNSRDNKEWYHLNVIHPHHNYLVQTRQHGCHFTDDIFKCIYLNENIWFSIVTILKVVPKGPINNIPVLIEIMARRRPTIIWTNDGVFTDAASTNYYPISGEADMKKNWQTPLRNSFLFVCLFWGVRVGWWGQTNYPSNI